MERKLRAGVIGASGIGKHHAKWLNALGCEVSFAGTSAESVAATTETLKGIFGFTGQGYVGIEAMLDAQSPDIVVVSSPANLHHEHFLQAISRGCHIMCEKPLQWDWDTDFAQIIGEAREMVDAAKQEGKIAAVNTQYAGAVAPYLELCRKAGEDVDAEAFSEFYMRMDSRGGKSGASGEKIWIDLGPHPLSVLVAFAGPGAIVPGSQRCTIEESMVQAEFAYAAETGREIAARIDVCNVPEGDLARRFGVDGVLADYAGRNDEDGVYAAYLSTGSTELKAMDFVQGSISSFVDAVRGEGKPVATLADGLGNLEMQLALLAAGRAG